MKIEYDHSKIEKDIQSKWNESCLLYTSDAADE